MMEDSPIVFVVDDDPKVRSALQSLIRSIGLRVMTFGSSPEFLQSKRPDAPSCLVLDVRMPGSSGLELQNELAQANLQIPIIFLTGHGDIQMSVRAIKAGAYEFLTKPVHDQQLLDAIQHAIALNIQTRQERTELSGLQERYSTLTPREREVFALVVQGMLNKQIAAELGASEGTIKIHRGQVMQKMKVDSLAELVRAADKLRIAAQKSQTSS
jgi:FixJ family two-component response regulator